MNVELRPGDVERLLALDRKFAKRGPDLRRRPARAGRVARAPERRLDCDAADAADRAARSRSSRPRWTPSPRRGSRSRSRVRAASASSTGTSRSSDQVAEVDKVKRSEAGMIVEPVTLPPDARVADGARADAPLPHLRRPDHGRRRAPGRHPHEPRPPLRGRRLAQPVSELMTSREPRHRAGRARRSSEAEEILHRAQDREAAGRRRRRPPARADHRQGHPEADRSSRTRRRTSAAGCASAPRSASGPTRSSARRRSSPPASTCSSSTRRTATRARSSRWCAAIKDAVGVERRSPATSPPATAPRR